MLDANEVTLMLSVHTEASGLAHIALNLLRTEIPMPRPFFEVRVPMLRWTLGSIDQIAPSKTFIDSDFFLHDEYFKRQA